jgi:hypothetical protein
MENAEIDRKLAEAMGYEIRTVHGLCMVNHDPYDPNFYPWSPTGNICHAWEVSERFGVQQLNKHAEVGVYGLA